MKIATKFAPQRFSFETAVEAGFEYAELYLNADYANDWQSVARMAGEFPLEYALHFPNRGDLEERTLANIVELNRALKCRAMVIHEPMFRRYHEQILGLDSQVRLAVENHYPRPDEIEDWRAKHEFLTLDVEHLWLFTYEEMPLEQFVENLKQVVARIAPKLIHVHLPGHVIGAEEHRPMYGAREMVFAALTILDQHGYDGFIVSEVEDEFQNVTELKMDLLLVQRWRELQQQSRQLKAS